MCWVSILTLVVFSYAAYTDVRERRVPDAVWVVYLALGLPLLVLSGLDINELVMSVVVVGTASFVSYRFGGLGGADVKGMLALSVLLHHHTLAVWAVLVGSCVALVLSRKYGDNNPFMLSLLTGIVVALVLELVGVFSF
ncbi:MAG: A24 family peptidase [Methermicoccaceae archaeon]